MILLCGLGNPGDKYKGTRHNAGFLFLDHIARKHQAPEFKEKWNALHAETTINGEKVLLLKPLDFMNLSGKAVAKFANFYKIPGEKIFIAYDDVDLKLGNTRVRSQGGAGTHNGMKSVIECLGTQNFPRLRIGIESRGEHAPEEMDISAFVLSRFTDEEMKILEECIKLLCEDFEKLLVQE